MKISAFATAAFNRSMVSVTAMQVGFEAKLPAQLYLRLKLHELFR